MQAPCSPACCELQNSVPHQGGAPDKDEHGEITRWMVMRTSTPVPDKCARRWTQCPAHEYTGSGRVLEKTTWRWRASARLSTHKGSGSTSWANWTSIASFGACVCSA